MKIITPTGTATFYDDKHPQPDPHEVAKRYGWAFMGKNPIDTKAQEKAKEKLIRYLTAKCRQIPYTIEA